MSNVLIPRDLVSRPDNMDKTVVHTHTCKLWLLSFAIIAFDWLLSRIRDGNVTVRYDATVRLNNEFSVRLRGNPNRPNVSMLKSFSQISRIMNNYSLFQKL